MTAEENAMAVEEVLDGERPVVFAFVDSVETIEEPGDAGFQTLRLGTPEFVEECKRLDHRSLGYKISKRIFDFTFSLFACIVGLIPGAILSLVIAIDTKGSPIYSQVRVGKYGKPFRILKFRSMVADADDVEKYFTSDQLKEWERERKVANDPRITKLGHALRAASIDEIPQFINVLLGQISVVGPRVITFDEVGHFGNEATRLLSVDPGITGAWQCGPRNLATFENGLRQKIELDYARKANFATDLKLFFKTFSVVFIKRTGK